MAEGIVGGALRQGVLPAGRIVVSDPQPARRQLFAEQFGVATTDDNVGVMREARCVMLAVKPQQFDEVMAPLAPHVDADHLFVSIMAGLGTARIAAAAPGRTMRVARVMPNLPIRVGAGVAGVFAGPGVSDNDLAFVRRLFDAGGQSVVLRDEALLDAVTAVSGSGPAYFYYVVEAIAAGGEAAGLPAEDALTLAAHTCLGAARMMIETGEPPAELRRKVTSKGGTTQAAIEHLESAGAAEAFRQAVLAAARRAKELGR